MQNAWLDLRASDYGKQGNSMEEYRDLFEHFVQQNIEILGDDLVGVYLHGSAVMGCLNSEKSDLDLLVVVKNDIPDETKRRYMDMVTELNKEAPAKGLELSIVKEAVCNPFVYPTPFELHFSIAHLEWYQSNPNDYVEKMKGTDKDLAAHITIIRHRGKTLCGKEIKDVFSDVSKEYYFDSIWYDIENAGKDIISNPMYIILNLCRVLAYAEDGLILSKKEGGLWGISNTPGKFRDLISAALEEYQNGTMMPLNETIAKEYAEYMLAQIRKAQ
jgi:streptomycin 3"-adenylyltransferase